jgi:hypothetical protein
MPTSPWRQIEPADPERRYTALLGFIRLKGFAILPRFAWHGIQIERQMRRTPGLVGYRVEAKFRSLEFFHLSAWRSADAIRAFVHDEPHGGIMQRLVGRLGETQFRFWTVSGSDLPLLFDREAGRLAAP